MLVDKKEIGKIKRAGKYMKDLERLVDVSIDKGLVFDTLLKFNNDIIDTNFSNKDIVNYSLDVFLDSYNKRKALKASYIKIKFGTKLADKYVQGKMTNPYIDSNFSDIF